MMRLYCVLALAAPILAALCGCVESDGRERYTPAEAAARQALDAALASWKNGQPAGLIADQSPQVQFADSRRKPGQKLVDYEILGEVASDGPRGFLVQLHLEDPRESPKVRYCVFGIDPLWVMTQHELEMITHWDCPPEDKEKK
jgi:hypothetical protein